MSPFVNIHCHRMDVGQAVSITNVFVQNRRKITPQGYYSLGLHPWHISEFANDLNWEETLNYFLETDAFLLAIGEIGLDRSIAVPMQLQISIFEKQLLLAQKYKLPVIIHCVRAYSELISCKQKLGITVPLIIHGYYGNVTITKELLKNTFCFSFGSKLFQGNTNAIVALQSLPINTVFFESDDDNYSIEELYQIACKFRNESLSQVKDAVFNNFSNYFRPNVC